MQCGKQYGTKRKPLICKKEAGHKGSHSIRKSIVQIYKELK